MLKFSYYLNLIFGALNGALAMYSLVNGNYFMALFSVGVAAFNLYVALGLGKALYELQKRS